MIISSSFSRVCDKHGGRQRVIVEVAASEKSPIDLFVEGPTPDWALPLPDPIDPAPGGTPGVRRFGFDLYGLTPGVPAALTFTAVSPNDAMEVGASLN